MTTEIGWAGLGIIPTFDKFGSELERGTGRTLAKAGESGGAQFGDAAGKSAGARFGGHIKKAAKVAAVGLAAASAAAIKFGGDALEEAREAQKVGALTESTIKSTGSAAKVTAKQVGDLAGAISEKAGIDDEAIQRGANLILTFKNIRNEAGRGNKIFNRATKTVTDMAAAMAGGSGGEIDMKAASIQVGKALNDPIKGVTALSKVGVTFTKQQRDQIKALVEGGDANAAVAMGLIADTKNFNDLVKAQKGDVAGVVDMLTNKLTPAQKKAYDMYAEGGHTLDAQKRILRELKSEFGGAAAAQATEADKLKVAWGNFKEEIGTALIPMVDDLARFLREKGIPAVQDFIGWFRDEGIPAVKDFADDLDPVIQAVKDLGGFIKDLPTSIKIGVPAGLSALLGYGKLRGGNVGGGGGALGSVGKAVGLAKPVPVVVTNWAQIAAGDAAGGAAGKAGKVGGFASKAFWPVAITVTAEEGLRSLFKFHRGDAKNGLSYLGKGNINDWVDKKFGLGDDLDKVNVSLMNLNRSAEKLPNKIDMGKTSAQALASEVFTIKRDLRDVEGNKVTRFLAPGFDELLRKTHDYYGLLDGLNGRTVETFIKTTHRNNDTGEGGGGRVPGRSGGINVENMTVKADDPNKWRREMEHRGRAAAIGAEDFR